MKRAAAALLTLALLATACSVAVETLDPVDGAAPTSAIESANPPRDSASPPQVEPTAEPASSPWAPALQDLVAFVERARGEKFDTVSNIRYVDPVMLQAEWSIGFPSLADFSPEDQRILERIDDAYRAMGLSNQDFEILGAGDSATGEIAAFYDWAEGEIVFPSEDGAELLDIPVADRPLLVHELGHALQIDERIAWTEELQDPVVALALLEGEAEWLLDTYIAQLSPDEYQTWIDSWLPTDQTEEPPTDQAGPPEILAAEFLTSYDLGGRFFHVRFALEGLAGIDAAFESHRVTAQTLLDPWSFSPEPIFAETFDYEVPLPNGPGETIDIAFDFPVSAIGWHQIFATVMPANEALRAAREVTSLSYPAGWIDISGQLCLAMLVTGDAQGIVRDALQTWADATDVKRWLQDRDDGYYVGGCDPGPGNVPEPLVTPVAAVSDATLLIDSELWAFYEGLGPDVGFCVGAGFITARQDDPWLDLYEWYDSRDLASLSSDC